MIDRDDLLRTSVGRIVRSAQFGRLSTVAALILIAAIVLVYFFLPRARNRVRQELLTEIKKMDEYAEDGELLMEMAESAHTATLWRVHNVRGQMRWGQRDEEQFIEEFVEEMVRDAQVRNRKDLQGPLRTLFRTHIRRKREEWGQ